MKRTYHLACLAALGAGGIVLADVTFAADVVTNRTVQALLQAAPFVWTDAAFASARPLTPKVNYLPPNVFDYNAAAVEAASASSVINVAGGEGGADARHLREEGRTYITRRSDSTTENAIMPQAVGTGAMHFTSTQTFPDSSDTTYPTRTIGKLYFRDPVNNYTYVCSGSMIKRGVVLTSGHCLHNGSNHFYTDFVFRPGMRKAVYPYGTWTNWVQGRTTAAWSSGGGTVPNTADWATIVFAPDSTGHHLGDYTGWLGYQSAICSGRHQTTLGYPVNLDSGVQMHRSDSQATSYGSVNNCTWGSDMTGGSSGGPVVLNFQKSYTDSSSPLLENSSNRVVATVSWGYVDTGVKVQGGSIVDSAFDGLIKDTCRANPSAC